MNVLEIIAIVIATIVVGAIALAVLGALFSLISGGWSH